MSITRKHLSPFTTPSGLKLYPILEHIPNPEETKGLKGSAWDIRVFPSKQNIDGGKLPDFGSQYGWIRRVGNVAQHVNVHRQHQKGGIGMELVRLTLDQCPDLIPDTNLEAPGIALLQAAAKKFNRPDWLEVLNRPEEETG